MKINKITLLFGLAFSFAFIPFSALAQDDVEEVVVTGTRIVDPNVTSSSQITSIDGEELLVRGITRVEDYLNDLPQICLLYTSPSPRDLGKSRMPSSA